GRHVTMMVRGAGLAQSMSRYLIHRIQETPNITLLTNTRIVALAGDSRLEKVTWRDGNGVETTADIRHVFMMTGADPNTAWLQDRSEERRVGKECRLWMDMLYYNNKEHHCLTFA